MKRVIWFTAVPLHIANNRFSGSWLYAMSSLLTSSGKVKITNIVTDKSGKTREIEHIIVNENLEEYLLPCWKLKNNIPSKDNCKKIEDICKNANADIIHIWGVENYYCHLIPTLDISTPVLLEMQGFHSTCADVYYGDLSIRETLQCFGLKEILFPFTKSIYALKHKLRRIGKAENEVIKKYKYITVQSRWTEQHIRQLTGNATTFKTVRSIRSAFFESKKWQHPNDGSCNFYALSAGVTPYKSTQTVIRALAIVKDFYPDVKLYIIGGMEKRNWIRQPGYLSFFHKLIKKLKLERNIIFTGSLTADKIVEVAHKCIGMVQTSYVESYSQSVAEAQIIGIPSVISYAGAMPELAADRESALFYSPGDYKTCAAKMLEIIEDQELCKKLSDESYKVARERNNDTSALEAQLSIYDSIMEKESCNK